MNRSEREELRQRFLDELVQRASVAIRDNAGNPEEIRVAIRDVAARMLEDAVGHGTDRMERAEVLIDAVVELGVRMMRAAAEVTTRDKEPH